MESKDRYRSFKRYLESNSCSYSEEDILSITVCLELAKTSKKIIDAFNDKLKKRNLSKGRFIILMILFNESQNGGEGLSPSELAEKAMVTPGTVTGLIDGLENMGLIMRTKSGKDRRKIKIQLTDKALSELDEAIPKTFEHLIKAMSNFTTDEKLMLAKLLVNFENQIDCSGDE
ncbi:MarR family transcriptional regulator [Wukongibacter baidiensis]|uniref:MarR family winged helix-turn-helix transcriptional regulator n=1 Tax=Wukongibacter baidiensis TaxID=1723361 RepID=UPI003D7F2C70